jgi:putative acetyltransferase
MTSPFALRPERPDDADAIRSLLDAAFSGPVEGRLVDDLRAGGHLVSAMVAVEGPALVGYAAWPRLQVEAAGKTHAVAGLAPLAVTPPRHRAGIGTALVQAGLADLRARGETLVFVLGDPVYYRRFGFSLETAHSFESPYAGEHFMALALTADAPKSGRVRYPPPFDALG